MPQSLQLGRRRREMTPAPERFPAPRIVRHGRFNVVRDDLILGGTKARALLPVLEALGRDHVAYACDLFGFGPIALARATELLGIRTTLVFPALAVESPTHRAVSGLPHVNVVVRADLTTQHEVFEAARAEADSIGAYLYPLGFDTPEFIQSLAAVASSLSIQPQEAWSLAGSGCLTRALQLAWPDAIIHAVSMGFPHVRVGRAVVHVAPEAPTEPASIAPPYPSSPYYDAKLWRFVQTQAAGDALIWNVA